MFACPVFARSGEALFGGWHGRSSGFMIPATHVVIQPRASDRYYDALGQSGFYRECHDTADLIFVCRGADGVEARVYQGGYMRANDIECLKQLRIGLVVNCTHNIEAPPWHGQSDAPKWLRFPIAGRIFDATRRGNLVLPYFERFHALVSSAIQAGDNVFIHCRAGAHRAGTCTAAYAVMALGLTPTQAVREVSKQRRVTQVTGDNMWLLLALYGELHEASAERAPAALPSIAAAPAASSAAAGSSSAPAAPAASFVPVFSAAALTAPAPPGASSAAAAPEAAAGSSSAVAAGTAASQADWDMVDEPADEGEDPPAPPANEPPQLPLPSEGIPAAGAFQLAAFAQGKADGEYASCTVSSTNFTEEDLAAQESADEAPAAAPAVPKRLALTEAVGRLLFMSWNAGGGARRLPKLVDEVGYHVFAIQEAHADQMHQMLEHSWVLEQGQCIGARKPNIVQTVAHSSIPGKIYWHVAEIHFDRPRLGLDSLVIMSVHLNNVHAKKPRAGPLALEEAIDAAIKACQDAGRPSLDIVCGDINMARPPLSSHDNFGRSSGSLKNHVPQFDISVWLCMVAVCRAKCGIAVCLPLWSARCSTLLLAAPCPCCSVLGRAAPRCAALRLLSAAPRCFIPLRCTQPLPGWAKKDPGLWHDATFDVLETRGIMPVSDWAGECCFAAVRAQWLEQLHVKGSSWGQQLEGKSEQEKGEIRRRFLEQCGAKQTSRGVSLCSLPTSTYCSSG